MSFNALDIVHDTKLESEVHPNITIHFHSVTDPRAGLRHKKVEEEWERQKELGSGSFGTVWLETCISGSGQGQVRAVKEIKRSADDIPSSEFARELEAMGKFSQKRYRHCFVQSFGWYETQTRLFIAMEYLECGDLHRYLCHPIPEIEASSITYQLLEGLGFMHSAGFAHRDLKPKNILVQVPGPNWWVKLADFGITKRIHESTGLITAIGTEGFMAPEVTGIRPLEELGAAAVSYTFAVDIWSLGMIVWRMVSSKSVFPKPQDLVSYVVQAKPLSLESNAASTECKDFIRKTLAASACQRPTSKDASEHAWVQLYGGQAVSSTSDTAIRNETEPRPEMRKINSATAASWTTGSYAPHTIADTALVDTPTKHINTGFQFGDNASIKVAPLKGHTDRVLSVAISSDSKLVASGSSDDTVRVWATATGKLFRVLNHGHVVYFVAFSRGARLLASAGQRDIKVWDVQADKLVQQFEMRRYNIKALSFLSDLKILAGVGYTGVGVHSGHRPRTGFKFVSLHTFDVTTGDLRELSDKRFRGDWALEHKCLCFSSDSEILISTSDDCNINIWYIRMKKVRNLELYEQRVCSIALSNDSTLLAIGSIGNAIEIRDMLTLKRLQTFETAPRSSSNSGGLHANSMVFINAAELATYQAGSKGIFIWEIATGKIIQKLMGHHDSISSVAASAGGGFIVSGSYDKTVKIWRRSKLLHDGMENLSIRV